MRREHAKSATQLPSTTAGRLIASGAYFASKTDITHQSRKSPTMYADRIRRKQNNLLNPSIPKAKMRNRCTGIFRYVKLLRICMFKKGRLNPTMINQIYVKITKMLCKQCTHQKPFSSFENRHFASYLHP